MTKVVFLCYYPLNVLPVGLVEYDTNKTFQPAPWIINLSNALAELSNIELHIVTDSSWVSKDYKFKYNGINFHVLRNPYSIPFVRKGLPSWLPISLLSNYYFINKKYASVIANINPDIIHSHGTEYHYSYVASKSGYPFIVSLQGIVNYLKEYLTGWNSYYLKKQCSIEREVIKNTINIISRAEFSDKFVHNINPGANVVKVDDIVDDIFIQDYKRNNDCAIFFAGNIVVSKGIEDLLSAFRLITRKYPEIKLRLAGAYDNNYINYLKAGFNDLDFDNKVIILGQLNRRELVQEFMNCSMFVFPSHFETSPNVIMEAMTLGIPIISTKTGGIPDMIRNGTNGILVDIKQPEEIAKSITFIMENNKFAEEIGNNAKREARERFNKLNVLNKLLNIYDLILSDSNLNKKT